MGEAGNDSALREQRTVRCGRRKDDTLCPSRLRTGRAPGRVHCGVIWAAQFWKRGWPMGEDRHYRTLECIAISAQFRWIRNASIAVTSHSGRNCRWRKKLQYVIWAPYSIERLANGSQERNVNIKTKLLRSSSFVYSIRLGVFTYWREDEIIGCALSSLFFSELGVYATQNLLTKLFFFSSLFFFIDFET